jgi:hypothetical protein
MFAEEFFLRKKFGDIYLAWADKTPSFFPSFSNWSSAGWHFSFRNVMKREYNGFFAIFISFAALDALKNYIHFGIARWQDIIHPFWVYAVIVSLVIFVSLRTLKKYTKILDEREREYV